MLLPSRAKPVMFYLGKGKLSDTLAVTTVVVDHESKTRTIRLNNIQKHLSRDVQKVAIFRFIHKRYLSDTQRSPEPSAWGLREAAGSFPNHTTESEHYKTRFVVAWTIGVFYIPPFCVYCRIKTDIHDMISTRPANEKFLLDDTTVKCSH